MTPEQATAVEVVRREFGTPREVRFPELWGPRVVVEAVLPERTVFVKAAGDADVRAEASTMELAQSAGVPVPEVLKLGVDPRLPGGHRMATAKAHTAFAAATPEVARGALIHGDLGPGEMFVDPDDGSVLCLVDWGSSVIGDPVYELARFLAGGPADDPTPAALLPVVIEHYIAGTSIDEQYLTGVLPLYQAHNAIFNADWSYRESVPWVDGLLAKADALLDQVLVR
jgi:hypothetical protein